MKYSNLKTILNLFAFLNAYNYPRLPDESEPKRPLIPLMGMAS
jgi:hypothetical protein